MSEERKKLLRMLAEGKINADEAERLLEALDRDHEPPQSAAGGGDSTIDMPADSARPGHKPKALHIHVQSKPGSGKHENVDIRVPLMLLKAGIKLGSFMPEHVRGNLHGRLAAKGIDIDLNKLDSASLGEIIQALSETSIDIDADDETVRIYCA